MSANNPNTSSTTECELAIELTEIPVKSRYNPTTWERMHDQQVCFDFGEMDNRLALKFTVQSIRPVVDTNPEIPLNYHIVSLKPTAPDPDDVPPYLHCPLPLSAALWILPPRDEHGHGVCSATRVQRIVDPRLTMSVGLVDGDCRFLSTATVTERQKRKFRRTQERERVLPIVFPMGNRGIIHAQNGDIVSFIAGPEGAIVLGLSTPVFQAHMEAEYTSTGLRDSIWRTILPVGQVDLPPAFWKFYRRCIYDQRR